MKKVFYLLVLLVVFISCKTADPPVPPELVQPMESADAGFIPYFRASGNEPFWNVQMANNGIRFQSLLPGLDSLAFPTAAPLKATDPNIKNYRVVSAGMTLKIQIRSQRCEDSMSGFEFPYTVTVEIQQKGQIDFTVLKGCGRYLTDQRLHDIWVLEQLNGRKVKVTDFAKELPLLELYAEPNTFMGFAGCNRVNGSLLYEKDKLQFISLSSTKMACAKGNMEGKFLKALQQSKTYKIKDNRLWLSGPSGLLIVLKKID